MPKGTPPVMDGAGLECVRPSKRQERVEATRKRERPGERERE